jgi:deoxyribodipyrimidine photo-lyase
MAEHAWSIGGVHDRAWFKREVYGSIRYMSDTGAAAKFKTKDFVQHWTT